MCAMSIGVRLERFRGEVSTGEKPQNYPKFAQKPHRIIPSLLSNPQNYTKFALKTLKRGEERAPVF